MPLGSLFYFFANMAGFFRKKDQVPDNILADEDLSQDLGEKVAENM